MRKHPSDVKSILEQFGLSDATSVRWVSLTDAKMTSLQRLTLKPSGGVMVTTRVTSVLIDEHMIEPVVLSSDGHANKTLPLRDILGYLMSKTRVGIRCDVSDKRTAEAVLRLLRFYDMAGRLRIPVWMHSNIIGMVDTSSEFDINW